MNAKEVASEMKLATTKNFGSLAVEVYENPQREFFMTRDQIGTALEYKNPAIAVGKIHNQNKERLDSLSSLSVLDNEVGNHTQKRQIYMYSLRGVMEICRFSRQPKADAFMDFCWDVMESLMRGETVSLKSKEEVQAQRQARFDTMVEKLDALTEARKQDRQAIDNVLYVCKQLSQQVQALQAHGGSYTPRQNPKGQSEWRTELYDIVHKISRLAGLTVNCVMSQGYDYMGRNYGWNFKDARKEYVEKFNWKGDYKTLSGIDIIESSEMYKSIFMSIMKDRLEKEKYDSECRKGVVSSLVKSKHPTPIPKELIPVRHKVVEAKDNSVIDSTPEIVAEAHAVEVPAPKKSKNMQSILKPVVEPIVIKLGDTSYNYQTTYRRIYEIVGFNKIDRMTRKYIKNHNKPPRSKALLFTESEKAFKLFESAAKELAAQY